MPVFVRRLTLMLFPTIVMVLSAKAFVDRTLSHEATVAAPVAEVWKAYTTSDGFASWAVAKAEIDLRVGGDMRAHYNPNGVLGDDGTIVNRIMAFDPERMLAIQNVKAPKAFKNVELFQQTWTVLYFEPLAPDRTKVRCVGLGWGEGPEWDVIYNFFKAGNAQELAALQKNFAPKDMTDDPTRVMSLLGKMVGGEWIHEGTSPDGGVFRVRNVIERGPDGQGLVTRGWLGGTSGMHPHSASMIWLEPGEGESAGEVRFQNLNENGGLARGAIRLIGCDSVEWDWNETAVDGAIHRYRVTMGFIADGKYTMKIDVIGDDGAITTMLKADFTRVDKAPEAFLKMQEPAAGAG